uniref:Uncharacterized protein n=1 Tax=Cacopsylla melanoneura TaxID=428564 RepID=A0A8D8QE51_9HEMI
MGTHCQTVRLQPEGGTNQQGCVEDEVDNLATQTNATQEKLKKKKTTIKLSENISKTGDEKLKMPSENIGSEKKKKNSNLQVSHKLLFKIISIHFNIYFLTYTFFHVIMDHTGSHFRSLKFHRYNENNWGEKTVLLV